MSDARLTLALVHDVFPSAAEDATLIHYCNEAKEQGADLVVLPELPLDGWIPETREVKDEDAEAAGGPREQRLRAIVEQCGIPVLGGWIAHDDSRRHNRAQIFDANGQSVLSYDKLHLPSEEGYWESDHYEPGSALTAPHEMELRVGVQLCSDMQRPVTVSALVKMGAEVLVHPRATPPSSADKWRTVLQATAITQACWVVSVNRPMGSPTWVIAPDGEIVVETESALTIVELDREAIARAREDYPGYLESPAALYHSSWSALDT